MDAVLEDIALALDAKAEVARIYGEEDRAVAYVDAAVMVRRNMSHSPDGCTSATVTATTREIMSASVLTDSRHVL